jgi:threonine dehydrogenase-like Zn-dependent dehydrogenase
MMAERFGTIPVNVAEIDPVAEIKTLADGRGVDVAAALVGLSLTM